jgi:hypothetical protein
MGIRTEEYEKDQRRQGGLNSRSGKILKSSASPTLLKKNLHFSL